MGIAGSRESYGLFVWHGHTLCVEKGWFICSRAICLLMRERYLRQQHTKKKREKKGSQKATGKERNEITECDNSPSIVCDRKDSNVFEWGSYSFDDSVKGTEELTHTKKGPYWIDERCRSLYTVSHIRTPVCATLQRRKKKEEKENTRFRNRYESETFFYVQVD